MNIRTTGQSLLLLLGSIMVSLFSCTKFKDNLDGMNKESGIIKIVKNAQNIEEAQIDETITVYAKIGEPAAAIKLYVSGAEAEVVSRGQGTSIIYPRTGGTVGVPMDTFDIIVPSAAKIGPGTIYFTINNAVQPALAFNVKRPDILLPNKVLVAPFLFTYSDSLRREGGGWEYIFPEELRDGPLGTAVITVVTSLTYDKENETFYFIDQQRTDNTLRIRKLKDGIVSTIGGGGTDYFATTGRALKLNAGSEIDMKAGPDGQLYFTNRFTTEQEEGTGSFSVYSLIQRLDPVTGKVEALLGNNGRSVEHYYSNPYPNYRGLEDGGKDSAMISHPRGLTFDKQGNLYFLDGGEYASTLLRRMTSDGGVETLFGKINREYYEFVDADDKTYHITTYSEIQEHSDGFDDEVRLYGATNMVQAGNGKFYILGSGAGWGTNIVEINMDTREAATVVGLTSDQRPDFATGTFKEVSLPSITTFDVDFDGNILYGNSAIYKMDLQAEVITKMVEFVSETYPPGITSSRHLMRTIQIGSNSLLGVINRIVFDQFGNLYMGYQSTIPDADVRIAKVIIER